MTIDQFDRLWFSVARVIGFVVGAYIIYEQRDAAEERIGVIVAAIGLCGPFVAQSVATVVSSYRGGTPPDDPASP